MKKKKPTRKAGNHFSRLTKGLLIMNLSMLCMLIFSVQVWASSSSYAEAKKLNLHAENATVEEVITQIEKQSEFEFFYNHELLDQSKKKVNLDIENETIHTVLDQLFDSQEVTYTIDDRHIVIIPLKTEQTEEKNDAEKSTSAELQGQQQDIEVSGTVTEAQTGEPLPGVNIVVQGTTTGTTTNMDGEYSIEAPEDARLVFTFVGYQRQSLRIRSRQEINVAMQQSVTELEEVVAVGYGSQRRSNITGSVSDVGAEAVEGEPVSRTFESLQGDISGLNIRQQSGSPGNEDMKVRIRGTGTWSGAGNEPLILIDGIPGSLDDVVPNNIENISVLKDASSAAIYGSRAANGVILVETSEGEAGEARVTYDGYVGLQEPQDLAQFTESWDYAVARNEAYTYAGEDPYFSQEELEKMRAGELPSDRHYEMVMDNYAWQTKHNLKISGGSEANQYMFSVDYFRKDGIMQNNLYDSYSKNLENWSDRYQVRLNVNSELHERLHANIKAMGYHRYSMAPGALTGHGGQLNRLVTRYLRQPAFKAARWPADGPSTTGYYYANVDQGIPWGAMDSETHEEHRRWRFRGQGSLTYELTNSLDITAQGGYTFWTEKHKQFKANFIGRSFIIHSPAHLNQYDRRSDDLSYEAIARYENTFQNEHEVNIIAGYSEVGHRYEYLHGYRDQFPNNQLYQLGAGSRANEQVYGSANEWGLRSLFARARYAYEGKYMLEANARYDGSSRFAPEHRYGFFPSFSAGWRISEESFIQQSAPWIYNLKLRGSWGQLGNQQIGPYPYIANISMGQNYVFGNSIADGAEMSTVPNRDISWETTTITDFGLDIALFEGELNMSIDYYNKLTSDILYSIATAGVLGMGSSYINAGEVKNTGIDFEMQYTRQVGNLTYGFSPNFSINHNEVIEIAHAKDQDIGSGLFVGEPLSTVYGYKTEGLFVDEEEIEQAPEQNYEAQPGLIRYKDISGNGRVTSEEDRMPIFQTEPKYQYGGNLQLGYNNLNFSVGFYGAGGMDRQLSAEYAKAGLSHSSNIQQWQFDNRWTKEDPNKNAKYPRMKMTSGGTPYTWTSTYWAWDATYLKIKNIRIWYDFPSHLIEPTGINSLRIYLSGRNIHSFDNWFPGWDPEMQLSGSYGGAHYPNQRIYSLGVNVQF